MNVALITWTVVLGGWVLPDLGSPVTQPVANNALPNRGVAAPVQSPAAAPARGVRNTPGVPVSSPYAGRPQAPAMSPTQASRQQMPPVPTAASAGGYGPGYANQPYGSGGSPYSAGGSRSMPGSPTGFGAPAGAPAIPTHNRARVAQPAQIGAGAPTGPSARRQVTKPFSNYQQLPVVSPYLNLDRPRSFDFDNYNTLVRPFVEQDFRNNQVQNQLQSLQNTIGGQQQSLQHLNRQMEFFQGSGQPRFFQDTGDYFPNR